MLGLSVFSASQHSPCEINQRFNAKHYFAGLTDLEIGASGVPRGFWSSRLCRVDSFLVYYLLQATPIIFL